VSPKHEREKGIGWREIWIEEDGKDFTVELHWQVGAILVVQLGEDLSKSRIDYAEVVKQRSTVAG